MKRVRNALAACLALAAIGGLFVCGTANAADAKKPNVVMLMSDDVGWSDYGCYGLNLGHPTPNIDRLAKEGARFTTWYGQASCTAGRSSFMTGRIPIRTALSVVVVPGDANGLRAETPTIAEFYQKNGYTTYFSGKWHLGDVPKFYPIEHGFDEMKEFAAYYPGVYAYEDTAHDAHPWFPKYNEEFWAMYQKVVNRYEWEGTAGKPAVKGNNGAVITLENLADFDIRQTDSAVEYIKKHAKDSKPFFMDVNFMGMHQRVVVGCQLMQSASDLFLGWTEGQLGRHFYLRQLKDMKIKMLVEVFTQSVMLQYAEICGWCLARAHARSGEPAKISGYMGKSDAFDKAIADFSIAYADQSERDHEILMKAVRAGRLEVFIEQEV